MASQKPADISTVAQDRLKILLASVPRFSIAHNTYRSITFTCFPRLPVELRQKIWGYAACHERIIKLNYKFPLNKLWKFGIEDNKVEGQSKAPAVLAVCSDSRKEALRFYSLVPVTHRFQKIVTHTYNGQGKLLETRIVATPRDWFQNKLENRYAEGDRATSLMTGLFTYQELRLVEVEDAIYINFDADRFLHCSLSKYSRVRDVARGLHNFASDVIKKIKHFDILFSEYGMRDHPIYGMWGFLGQIEKLETFNVIFNDMEFDDQHFESLTGHLYLQTKKEAMLKFMEQRIAVPIPDPLCMQGAKLGLRFFGEQVAVDLEPSPALVIQETLDSSSSGDLDDSEASDYE